MSTAAIKAAKLVAVPTVPSAGDPARAVTQSGPQQATSVSTPTTASVKISAAALAALKEATETPAQTTKEASSGDRAAKVLLAKAASRAASYKTQ